MYASILDVGTGAGNIAITVKSERPSYTVHGCDINAAALKVARSNAKKHHCSVMFFESNYVDDIYIEPTHIIANLPWGDDSYVL